MTSIKSGDVVFTLGTGSLSVPVQKTQGYINWIKSIGSKNELYRIPMISHVSICISEGLFLHAAGDKEVKYITFEKCFNKETKFLVYRNSNLFKKHQKFDSFDKTYQVFVQKLFLYNHPHFSDLEKKNIPHMKPTYLKQLIDSKYRKIFMHYIEKHHEQFILHQEHLKLKRQNKKPYARHLWAFISPFHSTTSETYCSMYISSLLQACNSYLPKHQYIVFPARLETEMYNSNKWEDVSTQYKKIINNPSLSRKINIIATDGIKVQKDIEQNSKLIIKTITSLLNQLTQEINTANCKDLKKIFRSSIKLLEAYTLNVLEKRWDDRIPEQINEIKAAIIKKSKSLK